MLSKCYIFPVNNNYLVIGILVLAVLSYKSVVWGEKDTSSISDYNDCASVDINFDDDAALLTAAEKTALMDEALYASLSRFDRCQASAARSAASATGSTASGMTSATPAAETATTDAETATSAVESTASLSTAGTETSSDDATDNAAQTAAVDKALSPGKIPEDIPPADNDSILQAQLREKAMAEQDPEKRAAIWNEYRKHKNLSAE